MRLQSRGKFVGENPMSRHVLVVIGCCLLNWTWPTLNVYSQESPGGLPTASPPAQPADPRDVDNDRVVDIESIVRKAFADPAGAKRLDNKDAVWVDRDRKLAIVDGFVTLRTGPLEMLACPRGTKEHESVVAVMARSEAVHAALLAIGATPGNPVRWEPEYAPAKGDAISVWVLWRDPDGKARRMRAQEWIREVSTNKPLQIEWVFGGSGFYHDPSLKRDVYMANEGDLICVANFASAMMDLPIESSRSDGSLQFAAFTENIPPRYTPVRMVLMKRSADADLKDWEPLVGSQP